MHKTSLLAFLFVATMGLSGNILAAADLFYLSGAVTHDPDDGVKPPSRAELIERAHQKALASYKDPQALYQVSEWQDSVYCVPVYRGSPDCYSGRVYSRATFIKKSQINDAWQARVSGAAKASNRNDGRCQSEHWAEARRAAEKEAEHACKGPIINKPINAKETAEQFLDTWYQECTYTATFMCNR